MLLFELSRFTKPLYWGYRMTLLPTMGWAWLLPALSAGAFVLIITFGKRLPTGGALLAPIASILGFSIFVFVLLDLLDQGSRTFHVNWLQAGSANLTLGMTLDPLSVTMLGLVTLVAVGVQVYSWGYMAGESRFAWYFALQGFFVAAMLALVLADNLLLLYAAWELVGLGSYLLIGFWYERRPVAEAAKKAFVTTRLGDVGLLIGILFLFKHTGSFNIEEIIAAAPDLPTSTVTIGAILLFLGAVGKSAQFPLHVWLPDAMEGPTPVSALIHAATMVAAGVYLVARMLPLFELSEAVMITVTSTGLLTALIGGTMALVMTDLKRILAYSTISHLGIMILALGSGGFFAGIFHLIVHAFAKAMLFLGAGNVSHATGTLDIRELGGLRRAMPVTTVFFVIGSFSLGGFPPLGGFFSKEGVLASVLENRHTVFFLLTLVVSLLSALYMSRALFRVFFNSPDAEGSSAHEPPFVMILPILPFAILSLILGFMILPYTASFQGLSSFLHLVGQSPSHFHLDPVLSVVSVAIASFGFVANWLIYVRSPAMPNFQKTRLGGLLRVVENKYYIDRFYEWGIDRIVLAFAASIALFDRLFVNDTAVNGVAHAVRRAATQIRYHVTGRLYNYAFVMTLGMLLIFVLWWAAAF
jgi:NADH-quinone oxidoreductase subunit L